MIEVDGKDRYQIGLQLSGYSCQSFHFINKLYFFVGLWNTVSVVLIQNRHNFPHQESQWSFPKGEGIQSKKANYCTKSHLFKTIFILFQIWNHIKINYIQKDCNNWLKSVFKPKTDEKKWFLWMKIAIDMKELVLKIEDSLNYRA